MVNQKKPDGLTSREIVHLPGEYPRPAIPEPVVGEYYYGRPQSKSAVARSYIQLILRQRRVIALTFLVVMAIGLTWIVTRPALYRSAAEMLVTPVRDSVAPDNPAQAIGALTRVRSVATEMKMLTSPDLLDEAFASLPESLRLRGFGTTSTEIAHYPIAVTNPRDTDVVVVEVTARNPDAAAALANQILRSNLKRNQETMKNLAELATKHVDDELKQCDGDYQQALHELASYKKSAGVMNVSTELQTNAQTIANLKASIAQARASAEHGRVSRTMLADELRKTSPTIVANVTTADNPILQNIDAEMAALQRKKAELLLDYKPTADEVTDIDQRIAEVKRERVEATKQKVLTKSDAHNPIIDSLQTNYINAVVEEKEAASQAAIIQSQANQMQGQIAKLPEAEQRITLLDSRIRELQETHSFLTNQKQALNLSAQSGGLPSTMPITAARSNPFPVSPNIPISVALLTIMAVLLAVGVAVARDQLDDRIHTSDSLESVTGRRVLASLPQVRNGFAGLVTDEECPPALLESFRILRGNILLSMLDPLPRVIMVTSAQAGDGKSTTVANLAATIAMNGKRVLIIDCDMRHPSIHYIYGLENTKGLSSLLLGDAPVDDVIQQTGVDNLELISAGPTTTRPPELLSSPAMQALVQRLRDRYDCILLDSTPMVHLSDGTILAGYAEGVLMVVSSDRTRHQELQHAIRPLEQLGVPILGMVYNRSAETPELEWRG